MGLQLYNQKRNFKNTPEPSGSAKTSASKLSFVVQRHKASHLHYDFRLEVHGTLKSWAVPKGPSLNPGDKRLAMMVEDHPYNYKNFAGIIPEGNYGAGIVEIWDEGYLSDLENSDKKTAEKHLMAGLKAGNLKFRLYGKKLKGEFALVKLKNGKQENAWLLLKHRDDYALDEAYSSEEHTPKNSPINKALAKEGKDVPDTVGEKASPKKATKKTAAKKTAAKKVAAKKSALKKKSFRAAEDTSAQKRVRYLPGETRKLSDFITPMLAKETDTPFSDKNWIYEIKWDGYRAIAEVDNDDVLLYSRNGNTFNDSYPPVVEALASLGINAVLDGEVVVVDENGKSSFQMLQHYQAAYPLEYRVFDVLSIDGKDVTQKPLVERKALLKALLPKNDVVKYSDHIEGDGLAFFDAAQENDLEGIIAKRADSPYLPGVRTDNWLKIKHHKTQEAIIAGFTAPGGSRHYFGALVLAQYKNGELSYIGHTGSGFNEKMLASMSKKLKPLIRKTSPFNENIKTNMPVTWVKPELVCEIKYTEITSDGRMRHPIFLQLRPDKKASEVTDKQVMTSKTKTPKKKAATKTAAKPVADTAVKAGSKTKAPVKQAGAKAAAKKEVVKKATAKTAGKKTKSSESEAEQKFGRITVKTTNLKKVFWPKEGITKGDVIDYYQDIADHILPFLKDRPESLKRNPNGIEQSSFFQKDAGAEAPAWVKSKKLFSESTNKHIDYILCNDAATLMYLNNLGCIELNPWHSTIGALDKPDYMIIDLDPSEKNTFEQVIETANAVKLVLDKAGAKSFCKTSGATGLHVYVPAGKKYTYDQLKDFAHLVCVLTQEQLPDFTSLERNLKKRGNKVIYLDHLQNRRGQTISSVYSLRPHAGATVSMPLSWDEVKTGLDPKQFNIHNAAARIKKQPKLFNGVLGPGIDLKKCLMNLEA